MLGPNSRQWCFKSMGSTGKHLHSLQAAYGNLDTMLDNITENSKFGEMYASVLTKKYA